MNQNEKLTTMKGANPAGRKALGRGLAALMSATSVRVDVQDRPERPSFEEVPLPSPLSDRRETTEFADAIPGAQVAMIEVMRLSGNAAQPRRHFPQQELDELAQSIRASGLLQPIVVRRRSDAPGKFEIVAGERRWRAAQLAGLEKVPVLIRELTDREAFALAIIENVQRADLNPIEEALAFQRLMNEFQETQADVARSVGKDRASIANSLRLLKLPHSIQLLLVEKKLTSGHGRALLMLSAPAAQEELADAIVREGLSVREAERRAALILHGEKATVPTNGASPSGPSARTAGSTESSVESRPNVVDVEERLRRALGTKVALRMNGTDRGEVRVSFFSREELERFLERVGA